MKALIVAAGKGERINIDGEIKPKPLYRCAGQHLIEHVISTLKQAGVSEFYIVIGFMKDCIKNALGDGSKYGVRINYIDNPDYEKANGWSVYQAKNIINEPFVLSMSDHIFQPEVVKKFISFVKGTNQHCLCVDKKITQILDLDDATKVFEENGKIINIHKKLTEFNSIDCGLFHLTPQFFTALERSQSKNDFSITGGVKEMADQNQMFAYDIKEGRWIDVDTRKELQFLENNFQIIFH